MSELKQNTKKSIVWSALDKGGQQFVLLLVGIVTMRLLTKEDFGLVDSLALYTGIANILAEGGLSAALIRKTDATERDYNTMFWFNILLGAAFYLLLWFAAPLIADYTDTPEITQVGRALFLTVICYSLGLIQSTLLIKRLDFRRLGIANVISVALGGAVAVILSINGYGVWALVFQMLTMAVSRTIALWIFAKWKPRMIYDWASFRSMFGFSSKLLLGNLANTFSAYFYASALAGYFVPAQVGLYGRANKVKETGVGFMTHTFGQSIYLMLSQLQNEASRFLQAFRKSVRTLSFLLFPLLLGLGVVAPPLIEIVIGEGWLPLVPLIRIFCFSGILAVLNYSYGNAIKVKGRSDITLVFDIVNAFLLILFFFLAVRYGLKAVVFADAAAKGIVFLCYVFCTRWLIGYRLVQQIRDLAPYAVLSGVMCALIWPLHSVIGNPWLLLIAQIGGGALFYLGVNRLFGSKVLSEVIETLKKRR